MVAEFTATDFTGWLMVGTFLAALWGIAIMVMIDPPVLVLRFVAPLLAASFSCGFILMGLDAT